VRPTEVASVGRGRMAYGEIEKPSGWATGRVREGLKRRMVKEGSAGCL